MKISEVIERLPATYYPGGKKHLELDANGTKTFRPLPGGSGLVYSVQRDGQLTYVKIWDPSRPSPVGAQPTQKWGELDYEYEQRAANWRETSIKTNRAGYLVGKLELDSTEFPLKNAVMVDTITVDEEYRGMGIAKSMYGIVLSILRMPLLTGTSQTPGGRRNWVSLSQIPGVEIKGYLSVHDRFLDTSTPEQGNSSYRARLIDTIMGKLGGQYMGKTDTGYHYFSFDVQPTTTNTELQAYIKTPISKIYGDTDEAVHTGLYAIWTG